MTGNSHQAFESFVKEGGTVILTGGTGWYDRNGKKRPQGGFDKLLVQNERMGDDVATATPGGWFICGRDLSGLLPEDRLSSDELLGFYRGGLVSDVGSPISKGYNVMAQIDRKLWADRYLWGGRMSGYIRQGLGYVPNIADPFEGAGVRFSAYKLQDGTLGKLTLHAVNYNLPLPEDQPIVPVEGLRLSLRVPDGWEVEDVRALEPGVEPEKLKFTVVDGKLALMLPEIRFYKLIDVSAYIK